MTLSSHEQVTGLPFADEPLARPPRHFTPAGRIAWAEEAEKGPFAPRRRLSGSAAQKAGIRYERHVHEHLASLFGDAYTPSPWFRFGAQRRARWCQMDGVLRVGTIAVLFEVKYSFSSDGWYQLRHLYLPVFRAAFPSAKPGLCLISRYFDPHVAFPEQPHLITDLQEWVVRRQYEQMGVFSWKP